MERETTFHLIMIAFCTKDPKGEVCDYVYDFIDYQEEWVFESVCRERERTEKRVSSGVGERKIYG